MPWWHRVGWKDTNMYCRKILIFVTVVFPKIYSCLSVPPGLTFLNIKIDVCLMNNEALLTLGKHLCCDILLSLYLKWLSNVFREGD